MISRKRHYVYVLAFSVAVWLFLALSVGGLVPIRYIKGEWCDCMQYYNYINISYIYYIIGGIFSGLLISYPLHRIIIVAKSRPADWDVPKSFPAILGQKLLGWKGLLILLAGAGLYLAGSTIPLPPFEMQGAYLCKAVKENNVHQVLEYIEEGYDIDTALHSAVIHGKIEVLKALLAKGGNINTTNIGCGTLLFCALSHKHYNILNYLIKSGADVNITNRYGVSLLDMATRNEDKSFLRAHGAKTGEELRRERGKK
jgi:hypothetical protein